MTISKLPVVALVGRPNVGKSTLFNRIVGRGRAIVHDTPGVTRDRLEAEADWDGRRFLLVDTGGLDLTVTNDLPARVSEQSLRAARSADLVLAVFDGRAGCLPPDVEAARALAATGQPVVCVINKIDTADQEPLAWDFAGLGLGDPVAVGAESSRGVGDLLDVVVRNLPKVEPSEETEPPLRLAIVGRPNVGKSSLLNRLTGDERVVVDAEPGTTRDSVDTEIVFGNRNIVLVDTAGVRRRARIAEALEQASVRASMRAIDRADVVLLVVDASEGITDQEARLARLAWERGRGLLLVANKWDLVRSATSAADWLAEARRRYPHFAPVPGLSISARDGTGTGRVLPAALRVERAFRLRISTRKLNQVLEDAVTTTPPPSRRGRPSKLFYGTAVKTAPPSLLLFVSDPRAIPESYLRYLEGAFRRAFPLEGTPLRLRLRSRPRRR